MTDALRSCRRTGCRWPADATLSFRYATREAWLDALHEEAHPAAYDLCPDHAGSLTVPRGWEFTDSRPAAAPPREPAGRDLPGAAPPEWASAGTGVASRLTGGAPSPEAAAAEERHAGSNRYAVLSAVLPRLAAEHAVGPAADDDAPDTAAPEVEGQLAMPVPGDPPSRAAADRSHRG